MGLTTIGAVAARPQAVLAAAFGQIGAHLWELANGVDPRPVIPDEPAQSIGAETTFPEDTADPVRIRHTLLALSERVARRLRLDARQAGAVTLKLRDETFRTQTRSVSLSESSDQPHDLYRTVVDTILHVELRVRAISRAMHSLQTNCGCNPHYRPHQCDPQYGSFLH